MNGTTWDIFTLVAMLILAVAVPLVGIWDFNKLARDVESGRKGSRKKFYRWTIAMEWGLVLGLAGYWLFDGRGIESLGLLPRVDGWQWLTVALGAAASVLFVWQMKSVLSSNEKLEDARLEIGALSAIAAGSASELRLFNAVAISAGVCEEILYRGVLMAGLTPLIGVWPAVALSSIIFGLGHAYQGFGGMGKTTLIGLVMALLTVFSGSLFIAIVLHSVIDLTSGRIMWKANTSAPEFELQTS